MNLFLDNLMEEDDIVVELDLLASNIKKIHVYIVFNVFIFIFIFIFFDENKTHNLCLHWC